MRTRRMNPITTARPLGQPLLVVLICFVLARCDLQLHIPEDSQEWLSYRSLGFTGGVQVRYNYG